MLAPRSFYIHVGLRVCRSSLLARSIALRCSQKTDITSLQLSKICDLCIIYTYVRYRIERHSLFDSNVREVLLQQQQLLFSHVASLVCIFNAIALPPVAKLKWSIDYEITDDEWHSFFQIPFCSVRDTAIQYFQYRILHRVLGLNTLLFKMKMTDSPKCSFCHTEDETIEHFFWDCRVLSSFLLDAEFMFLGVYFIFKKRDILFGYNLSMKHPYNFLFYI